MIRIGVAVRRELAEEALRSTDAVRPLGVIENRFTHEGERAHGIVFEAAFRDPRLVPGAGDG